MSSQAPSDQAPENPQGQNQSQADTSAGSNQSPPSHPSAGFAQQPGYAVQQPPLSGKAALQVGAFFGVSLSVLLIALSRFVPTPIFFFGLPAPAFLLAGLFAALTALLAGLFAALLAGLFAAKRTGKVSTGALAGLWSGIISTIVAMAAFFIALLQELGIDFISYTPGMVWIGLVLFMIVLSTMTAAIGSGLGALGGLVGKTMSPLSRQSYFSYQPASSPMQAYQEFSYQSSPPLQGLYGYPPPGPYGVPPYQQPGYGYAAPPAAPLPLGEAIRQLPRQYIRVLTKPSVATFAEEQGKAAWNIVWVQLLGMALLSAIFIFLIAMNSSNVPAGKGALLEGLAVAFAFGMIILVPLFFFIGQGIYYLIAKAFGGRGTFLAQSYSTLLFSTPMSIVGFVLGRIPFLGFLISIALAIHGIVLSVYMTMAVHRMSGCRATLVYFTPVIAALLLLFCLIAFVLIETMAIPFYGPHPRVFDLKPVSFSVGIHPTIVINDPFGTIDVHAGSAKTVTIHLAGQYVGSGNPSPISYVQSKVSNTITVNVESSGDSHLDVTAPSNADLQVETNSGDIDVTGVSGQMSLSSNGGTINATDDSLSGLSKLETTTGSITFNGSLDPRGTYLFGSTTGSVDVTLPANSSFHVDATASSISSAFPEVKVSGAEAHGDVGSPPRATVTLSAGSSINLNKQ